MEILLVLILLFIALPTTYAAIIGAPLMLTSKKLIDEIIKTADLKDNETYYELGVGTGRVITAFSQNKKIKVVGFELSPLFYSVAFLSLKFRKIKNCKLYWKNFLKYDLSAADAVFCFLVPKTMEKLKVKFLRELKPGTKIISYAFEIKNWQPYTILKEKNKPLVYFYKMEI